jgi:hypothetical protein
MKKDIYRLLNNADMNISDYEKYEEYEKSEISKAEKQKIVSLIDKKSSAKGKKNKTKIITVFAVISAAVVSVAGLNINRNYYKNNIINSENISLESEITTNNEVSDILKNTFSISAISASAKDSNSVSYTSDFSIVNTGLGVENFTGLAIKIDGNNIKNIDISVSEGALMKVNKTSCSSLPDTEDIYMHNITTVSEGNHFVNYELTYIGNEINEQYSDDIYYGFAVSKERTKEITSQNEDNVKESFHSLIDEFDNSTLDITVTYNDDSKESKSFALRSGKVKVDVDTMETMQEFITSENEPWIYGILGTEIS